MLVEKTKEIIGHFNFKFNKSFGQNFLINEEVLEETVENMNLNQNNCVIEIGAGIGTLTQEMAKNCKRVVAIEIDDKLIPVLEETLGDYSNVKIIHKDVLKVDFKNLIEEEGLENVKISANLPYYLTTPIITKIFNEKPGIESLTLMIQKEVGERIMAAPNTDGYGVISTLVQYYAEVEMVCSVPPSSFIPQPRVDSVVINITIRKEPKVKVLDEALFFRIIKTSFSMRRKTLWNVLKQTGLKEDKLTEAFEISGIDPKRRGETLSLEEFGRLSDEVKKRS
ncbi:MAG: rsmA [Clostridiales bacterium]|nr:rsmA [Clostridiales bacterium]